MGYFLPAMAFDICVIGPLSDSNRFQGDSRSILYGPRKVLKNLRAMKCDPVQRNILFPLKLMEQTFLL